MYRQLIINFKAINPMGLRYIFLLLLALSDEGHSQYQFADCATPWDPNKDHYETGEQLSYLKANYTAKYWTSTLPGSDGSWTLDGKCGDGGLGPDYSGPIRKIGYLPTWIEDYDIATQFDPGIVTHVNIAFLMFQQNNDNYNSEDFASIAFNTVEKAKIDSVLVQAGVLKKAKQKGVTVSVALGGATDYAFVWLMNKYYNSETHLNQIADLITQYITETGIDGVDLDMECWWADPSIRGTTDVGGRVRGDKWGGTDQGPHPAGIGLKKLTQKLRERMPNKLLSAAVFGTSWYGNNYDGGMAEYMDWLGLMTYDYTGSWNETSFGPHSSLYKLPLNSYPRQSADNPIYSTQDALEYWMGFAEPAWNHAGGHKVAKNKLTIGVPLYGYDFSQRKPNNGNGYLFVPYKEIVAAYPNAATRYDPLDTRQLNGLIEEDGRQIYYDTPKSVQEKLNYAKDYGHQGVIIWELTQDVDYSSPTSLLRALGGDFVSLPKPLNRAKTLPDLSGASVELFDKLGRKVKSIDLKENSLFNMETSNLPRGVYFAKIVDTEGLLLWSQQLTILSE